MYRQGHQWFQNLGAEGAREIGGGCAPALMANHLRPLTLCRVPALKHPGVRDRVRGSSEHPHLGLGTEHPLLNGCQDHGHFSRHVVRLGADMTLAIEEQHLQSCCYESVATWEDFDATIGNQPM